MEIDFQGQKQAKIIQLWWVFEPPNYQLTTKRRHAHWRRLVKNIGWANQNIGGKRW